MLARALLRLAGLTLLALSAGCSKPEPKWVLTISDSNSETLCRDIGTPMGAQAIYCGLIDDKFVTFLSQSLAPHQTELVLTSQGGLIEQAIEARHILDQKGIKLIIRRLCASACAHFILLPDKNPTIEPDTLIAFHHTSTSMRMTVKNAPGREKTLWWANTAELERKERAFYKSYGLDENWLVEADLRLGHQCLANIQKNDTPFAGFGFRRAADFWTPTRGMIEKFTPMKLDGYWPVNGVDTKTDVAEVKRLRTSQFLAPFKMRINVGGDEKFYPEKWSLIQDIPLCKDMKSKPPPMIGGGGL